MRFRTAGVVIMGVTTLTVLRFPNTIRAQNPPLEGEWGDLFDWGSAQQGKEKGTQLVSSP